MAIGSDGSGKYWFGDTQQTIKTLARTVRHTTFSSPMMRDQRWHLTRAGILTVFVGVLALVVWQPSASADDPVGFRDIPFGASVEEVKSKMPSLLCRAAEKRELLDSFCVGDTEIADTRVNIQFWFFNGRMGSFNLSFKPDEFRLLKEAFTGRYGPPTQSESNEFKTRGGLGYVNEELTWRFKNGATARLSKYSTRSDRGSGSVLSKEYDEERRRCSEELREA